MVMGELLYFIYKIESKILLSVGRFTYDNGYGKGFDYLMKIAKQIDLDTGIYIVGDEPTKEFINWKKRENLKNIHFVGFKTKDELAEYYIAADLFILLTRGDTWGLVINEAMAYALPIISSDKCVAAVELIKEEKNGYIVPLNDINYISKKIKNLLNQENLLKEIAKENQKKIQDYTIENMTKAIYESIV